MEELKLVVEALTGLGAQAKEAFIWWLVFDKLIPPVMFLAFTVTLAWTVLKVIRQASERPSEEFIKWARDELRTGVPGPLTDVERARTVEALRRIVLERNK